jgi:catechol 2,3-dioxygenase-like lactoylglutathione lyase family enzyme
MTRFESLPPGSVPRIKRVLETSLYVDDLEESTRFYERVMGLNAMSRGDRLVALDAGEGTVLLLFRRGATTAGASFPGGRIPPHAGEGPAHFAFAVAAADLDLWRAHLADNGVEIESEVTWDRGGTSLYFRDPEGHSVEVATPGVWEVY